MAAGWSPLGVMSETIWKAMPPSLFSGRGGRCGVNAGMPPDTSGCAAIIGCWLSTSRARSERSAGLASSALRDAVMSAKLREGGPVLRRAGRVERLAGGGDGVANSDAAAGRNGACGASANPAAADRLVSGVPPARSAGGGGGLPDLPREARGFGVELGAGFGVRGMREIYGLWRGPAQGLQRITARGS